jgi:hypothetical protein
MAKSISVAVAEREMIEPGRPEMINGPVAVSIETGNPATTVVAVVETVVAGPDVVAVVVAVVLPQAEITAAMANARKGILLKKTSSLSEDEGVGRFRKPHDFAFIRDASCVPERQAAWLAVHRIRIGDSCPGRA